MLVAVIVKAVMMLINLRQRGKFYMRKCSVHSESDGWIISYNEC
jgi:hypothetical protein